MKFIAACIYMLAVICLTCYMTVNYGWYWIFLLLFTSFELKGK